MNTAVKAMLSKNFLQAGTIPDISFIKRDLLTGDFFYTLQCQPAGINKIIYYYNTVTSFKQFNDSMRADVTSSACD